MLLYDQDEYRLPPGVKRTGYDADTGEYFFSDGSKTAPYVEYGTLVPAGAPAEVAIAKNQRLTNANGQGPVIPTKSRTPSLIRRAKNFARSFLPEKQPKQPKQSKLNNTNMDQDE
ncbi:hypothetical protein PQX77_017049 [Marasmius sp. AFHP31]|nr:hypothetical protein PQX77_017049 [Marasmius sp. AFHP31]